MNSSSKTLLLAAGLAGIALAGLLYSPDAAATTATGGTEFDTIYGTLKGWVQGTLGKFIALAAFLVGMAIGIVRQSAMAAVVGIGIAIALVYGPDVIDNIFGTTLPPVELVAVAPQAVALPGV